MTPIVLNITPVSAPRQSQRDKFKPSAHVKRYRAFRDEVAWSRVYIPLDVNHIDVEFVLPMPESWSIRKRNELNGQPHRQTPDIDNLVKAFFDAVLPQGDAFIPSVSMRKTWGIKGRIIYFYESAKEAAA